MAYIYQADVWCDACGEKIIAELIAKGRAPADPKNESSYDSDEFPKYYDAENDESDIPENCTGGNCGGEYEYEGHRVPYGAFLKNPLTPHGYDYLKELIAENKDHLIPPVQEWIEFYEVE